MRLAVFFALTFLLFSQVGAQSGEELYNSVCAACHTINKGKLIGPDLSGVYNKRDMPWLISFIRSSQQMIKSNDPEAVAIFEQYSGIPMPDNNLSDQQIMGIIDYIRLVDATTLTADKTTDSTLSDSTAIPSDSSALAAADTISVNDAIVQKGRAYFYGVTPFQSKSVTCMACHNINDGSLFGGGRLAINLTGSYTKLGSAGITAILRNPPFPAMKSALKGPLTDEEIASLNSLFKSFAIRGTDINGFMGGMTFLVTAFLGGLFLATFLFLLYDNRRIPRGIS